MTLPATDTWDVKGVDGPAYKVGSHCSMPTCTRPADHAHHIVRRSQLAGDYRWIQLHGKTVGNLTGLCWRHHDEITGSTGGHKAAIRISAELEFFWCTLGNDGNTMRYERVGLLEPQPPTPETLAARAPGRHGESDPCPYCGQARARRRSAAPPVGRRRARKTWLVKVPDEASEDGADVLDTLVHELGLLLGVGGDAGARYYTLVPSLTYCLQDGRRFTEAIKGEGG